MSSTFRPPSIERLHEVDVADCKYNDGLVEIEGVVSPSRKPYKTKDGYVAALVYNDKHWKTFVEHVKPHWATSDLDRLEDRAKQIERVYGLLGETFATRTTADWLELLRDLNIPASPLLSTDDLFDNAHLNAVGFFETVESDYGPIRFPGVPTWFSETPGRVAGPAPRVGEHNEEVLEAIGAAMATRAPANALAPDRPPSTVDL